MPRPDTYAERVCENFPYPMNRGVVVEFNPDKLVRWDELVELNKLLRAKKHDRTAVIEEAHDILNEAKLHQRTGAVAAAGQLNHEV